MKVDYKTKSKNGGMTGTATGLDIERCLSGDYKLFEKQLGNEWVVIPEQYLDYTEKQNFVCYMKKHSD